MAEAPSMRLSKAAKEYNTSSDHIIDFLNKNGIKIESNPNTKLPAEAIALLQKEFQTDKSIKEEAIKITQSKAKRDAVVVDADVKPKAAKAEEDEQKVVLIKNTPIDPLPEVAAPKVEATPDPEPVVKAKAQKLTAPKVLDKIELDDKNNVVSKGAKKKKEEPIVEATAPEAPPTPEVVVPDVTIVPIPVDTTPVPPALAPEAENDVIKAKADRLVGPTVLGKIVLPVDPPKKKPVASSDPRNAENDKKKRKRKENLKGTPIPSTEYKKDGPRKPGAPNTHGPKGPGQRFNNREPKAEPTEKEIQDQIKATLARLSGGGKSKGSKFRKAKREAAANVLEEQLAADASKKNIQVTEFVSANELAKLLNVSVNEIISTCMSLGMFVSINQRLDAETLNVVAEEFGYTVEFVSADVQEFIKTEEDTEDKLQPRAPIVTVMGHVDHGKTSLLDHVRKANVIAGEAGGITQHIGAYEVTLENGKKITFLDTPGHEAFTAMRARGAKVTDVAIIVIAADDSVMPQTVEAINHAQAAGVPIVFAFNKVDKPDANPERLKEQLSKMNILVEDWGGKYQCQAISAKKGMNVTELLDKVLLEAEILDLKANPDRNANGTVIESSLDKGRGYVTTLLVQGGNLKVGDVMIAGCHYGRVKALFNERGQRIKEAGPSTPVQILGMQGAPQAGDHFNVMDDEREAREIANKRLQLQREQGIRTHKHITLDEIGRRLAIGNFKELNVIVKGDVDGSIEALSDSLLKLSNQEVQINVIHKSVGAITESDVLLASASDAIIVGFQVRPSVSARKLAEQEEIDIRLYSIIYDAINELKSAIEGMLAPEFQEKIVGNIEIREVFKIPKVGTIAGCMVLDGKINRNTKVRVVREGIVVFSGELASLKRFKDDVKEVSAGYECGLNINNFNDIKIGDIIEGYEQVAVKRTLASAEAK
ncbi:MAG: translation initiation factor [Bacteroidota bacterium]|jgi:translation initiation factor IF-2